VCTVCEAVLPAPPLGTSASWSSVVRLDCDSTVTNVSSDDDAGDGSDTEDPSLVPLPSKVSYQLKVARVVALSSLRVVVT
jgi:hypothetical protein